MMRLSRAFLVLTFVALMSTHSMAACYFPWNNQPPQGTYDLSVPFFYQNYVSQDDVYNWILTFYPGEVGFGGSMSPRGMALAGTNFTGQAMANFYYVDSERRQAVADQKKAIYNGNPTMVLTNAGLHTVILKGGYWQQLATWQPQMDTMVFHDSDWSPNIVDTVDYWAMNRISGCYGNTCVQMVGTTGQRSFAAAELAEYDEWGGTYYGDPDPPSGCGQCQARSGNPSWLDRARGLLAFVRRPAGSPASSAARFSAQAQLNRGPSPAESISRKSTGVRQFTYVPHPYATKPNDIIENFVAGVQQTRMSAIPGWNDLDQIAGRVRVTDVRRIRSLSRHPNYYLLTLKTRDGVPYAVAAVKEDGWLMSASVIEGSGLDSPRTELWATNQANALFNVPGVRFEAVYGNTTMTRGSSLFSPLFLGEMPGIGTVYVNSEGEVFGPDPAGAHVLETPQGGSRRFRRLR
jgi:hypothetical protein